jgi:hypothetical protein
MSPGLLIERQNPDGGWSYRHGKSQTEPTVYAVLALIARQENDAADQGLRWLRSLARPDGGWPPQAGVDQSTWVTALVALLPPDRLGAPQHGRAVRWLSKLQGVETTTVYRLRQRLLGNRTPAEQEFAGWPWMPGNAAWVAPTSTAILALEKQQRREGSRLIQERIETGRRFLLSRTCPSGGWNHGGVPDQLYHPIPYPEVTGMALAALRGVASPKVTRALELARTFLTESRSADAINWLRLGLAAHGRLPEGYVPPEGVARRTLPEIALDAMWESGDAGRVLIWG